MIFGFVGMPREGKSMLQSILAEYCAIHTRLPLYANYDLKDARRFGKFREVAELSDCIIAWDEIHHSMDSRNFKDLNSQVYGQWLSIISHFRTTLFWTSQFPHMIDKRLRDLTDYMIFVTGGLRSSKISAVVVNWSFGTIVGRFTVAPKEKFYGLYDSFAIIKPTEMERKKIY